MLKDQFGRNHDYLRISLTDKCNFRCLYCMPENVQFMSGSKLLNEDEIIQVANIFVHELGINKIRLTGGEPLLRKEFASILSRISELPVELALTTNGVLIDKYLEDFKKAGLRNINVSLDSLDPDKFDAITRRDVLAKVWSNIQLLRANDFHVKINVVVMKGMNDDEVLDFIRWTENTDLHVRFIEFMPFAGNKWEWSKMVPYKDILKKTEEIYTVTKLNDKPHSTSKSYKVDGFKGTFAFITSVTSPFCDSCNRLRVTADGKLRICLFAKEEIDLLKPLRSGEDIIPIIQMAVKNKAKQLGGLPSFKDQVKVMTSISERSMVKIGG